MHADDVEGVESVGLIVDCDREKSIMILGHEDLVFVARGRGMDI